MTGKSGLAQNGVPSMGDCIQQIHFEITDILFGTKRSLGACVLTLHHSKIINQAHASSPMATIGPYGAAKDLSKSANVPISWSGRLCAFAGCANDSADQVGLRGISFVEYKV